MLDAPGQRRRHRRHQRHALDHGGRRRGGLRGRVKPLFDVLGNPEKVIHIGGPGAGQLCKLCNQMVIGGTLAVAAEALALAKKSGVDAAKVREALLGGFAQSRVLEVHGDRALKGTFKPGFKTHLLREGHAQRRGHAGRARLRRAGHRGRAAVAARDDGGRPRRGRQFDHGQDRVRHRRRAVAPRRERSWKTSPTPRDLVALQTAGPVPLASLRSLWWRVPTVAAAYFVAARLGFLLDLEPGFASSIWPAAGIGSAALLIWGARLWPGVLLGSFLFNWWLSELLLAEHGHDPREPADIVVSLVIAGGVALQALLLRQPGAARCSALGPRAHQRPQRGAVPAHERAGVVPGVGERRRRRALAVGRLPLDEVWPNWFTWWMGDSIGVLFFVPLTLLAFPEARPRRLGLAARLAIPLIVVGVLVAVAHRATQDSRREHTSREMAAIENELQFQLNCADHEPASGRAAAHAGAADRSPAVRRVRRPDAHARRADARVGAASDRRRARGVRGGGQRAAATPFRILEPTEIGRAHRAPRARPEYFPTLYVEPLLTADTERGLDHSTDPIRRAAMSRARDTGQATVTAAGDAGRRPPDPRRHRRGAGLRTWRRGGRGAYGGGAPGHAARVRDVGAADRQPGAEPGA